MELILKRTRFLEDRILGNISVRDEEGVKWTFQTLELPDRDNQKEVSCIPAGSYDGVKRWSKKYKNHFMLLDVPDREGILIHVGNYPRDTRGCILVGTDVRDIDNDNRPEVVNSKTAMERLNILLKNEQDIKITIK